jgi:hypothetical protein
MGVSPSKAGVSAPAFFTVIYILLGSCVLSLTILENKKSQTVVEESKLSTTAWLQIFTSPDKKLGALAVYLRQIFF